MALEREIPGGVEQLDPRERLAGPAHERLEQDELLGRQLDLDLAPPDAMPGRVEPEVADGELGRARLRSTASEGAQPREQLAEREGLAEVVVGTRVEALDSIVDRVTRRQHQHRCPDVPGAECPARREPVDSRQHHVEHDRVVRRCARHPERRLAGDREVGGMALLTEAAHEEPAELGLVLDDKDPHARDRLGPG